MSSLPVFDSGSGADEGSIREFTSLDTPIYMFDKDGEHVVMTLEQVRPLESHIPTDI